MDRPSPPLLPADSELLRSLIEVSELLVILLDRQYRVCLFNRACEITTGYSADQVLGRPIWERLLLPEDRDQVSADFERLSNGRQSVEREIFWLTSNGRRRWIHWRNVALAGDGGEIDYLLGTGIDITARKAMEDVLRHDEYRLRLVVDNLPSLIAFLDREHHYRIANRSHFNWFGMDPGALRGRHVSEIIGESAYRALKPHYEEALRDGTSTYLGEVPYARGGKRYIHGTAVVGRSPAGDADGIVVLVSDLTEHKLMERALDASTRRSQAVLDTAVDGIIIIDENGVIGSFNPGAEKLFGYSAREVIGRNVKMLMPQAYAENHDAYLHRYLETGERRIIGIGREVSGLRKDGSEIPLDLAVGEFIESGRRYFAGFTRDISARKSAEREARARLNELAHVTRVSAMGDLASGIAHEVNQPLTAIVTMTQALLRSFRAGRAGQSLLEETLEKIVRQGRRASSILQQMREFIGKEKTEDLGLHDVDEIVSGVVQLFSHEFDYYGIRVRTKFGCAQARVRVNRIQIEQVMVNLVQNAVQAMTDVAKERVLTLRTHRPVQEPRHVEVSVADTGVGLPPGSEGRIFEPFFTTRAKGLGQGLSISRSIIDAHGGTIRAAANGDAGTTFVFTLPLATAAEP